MSKSSIALILSAILIMSIATFTTTASAQQGEIQEESDGGLTATLNGDSFTTGDTITVTGTVEERDINSSVCIEVIDPNSESIDSSCPDVTVDNTFTFSFEAGINSEFYTRPMETSGNYRMILTYLVPDEPTSGEDFSEEVEFVFAYRHVEGQQQQQQQQTTYDNDTATTNPIRRTINVTAINNMVTQGLNYVEKLNATIQTNATDTGNILRDVNATQRVLQNIQGNLTGVIPLAQGEVFLPTNTTRSATT